ncbi:MAG: methyl-accepting chemotaxis protein [Firmicutes bacterium]|nr:methyl-accepting chemotaxis protein [Bacillota bacterium]
MNERMEAYREFAEKLVNTYETECAYFISDRESYTFVEDKGLGLPSIQAGQALDSGGLVHKCVTEKRFMEGTIPRNVHGKRLKVWAWPIPEGEDVKGSFGVAIHKFHPVGRAFPHLAKPLAESFPEGALLIATDLEKILLRQPSPKFDLPSLQSGTPLKEGGVAIECIRNRRPVSKILDASMYGKSVQAISIPLFDPDDGLVVATFGVFLPRALAEDLQETASRLKSNIEEIASVMQEVAASAGEISVNEGQLAERVREVAAISAEINEILDFIKNVADQTKMLGLNAAIEAARAGENGKGFGVVAEEIRKLSDQSKETADRIRALTMAIGDKINTISGASEGTLKQSQEQAAATEEVTASVTELALLADRLAQAAKDI